VIDLHKFSVYVNVRDLLSSPRISTGSVTPSKVWTNTPRGSLP
jgi:hypothetical protein